MGGLVNESPEMAVNHESEDRSAAPGVWSGN